MAAPSDKTPHIADQVRTLRENVQRQVAPQEPTAYSLDGRQFAYETPLSLPLVIGSYVVLDAANGRRYLGQVITQDVGVRDGPEYSIGFETQGAALIVAQRQSGNFTDRVKIRFVVGSGTILAAMRGASFEPPTFLDAFEEAKVSPAPGDVVAAYLARVSGGHSSLDIGHALFTDGAAPVVLQSNGFDRHTFLCGQSGSGKTFALGIVLEQLLLDTQLRIIVVDPNSDFVNLASTKDFAAASKGRSPSFSHADYAAAVARYDALRDKIRVMRPPGLPGATLPLRVKFSDLGPNEQATVLGLDALRDREEYNLFRTISDGFKGEPYTLAQVLKTLEGSYGSSENRPLRLRIRNLGIVDWSVWSHPGDPSIGEALQDEDWRCLVIDIGTLPSAKEKSIVAAFVLDYLWQRKDEREPVLIVVDEAHNVCPSRPATPFEELSTEVAIRIAGEGRKYGLYFLLATQRPTKLHPSVISQCDNLILMRMNSRVDLNDITDVFSQVPQSLLQRAPTFAQGESLIAGRIIQSPTFAKFQGRLSQEGGSDVPTTWASPPKATP